MGTYRGRCFSRQIFENFPTLQTSRSRTVIKEFLEITTDCLVCARFYGRFEVGNRKKKKKNYTNAMMMMEKTRTFNKSITPKQ